MTAVTEDTFFNGRLKVRQPREGYRYSIDAVLLAGFFQHRQGQTVVDLGTGCGIVPLALALRHPDLRLFGVEIQDELAGIAHENVRINGLEKRVRILHRDLKVLNKRHFPGRVHQVVCNPPYRRINSGRVNPHDGKAGARHEIFARLVDFVDAAARLLEISGRFTCVYPAVRLIDVAAQMRRGGIEPKRMRMVHSRADEPARLVLVNGVKGGRPGLDVEPPLAIYEEDGAYTHEMAELFQP